MKKTEHIDRNEAIVEWLLAHPAIKFNVIAESIGYKHNNNSSHILAYRKKIPKRVIPKMERKLAEYGFSKDYSKA